jgi:hypothetical protein
VLGDQNEHRQSREFFFRNTVEIKASGTGEINVEIWKYESAGYPKNGTSRQ